MAGEKEGGGGKEEEREGETEDEIYVKSLHKQLPLDIIYQSLIATVNL